MKKKGVPFSVYGTEFLSTKGQPLFETPPDRFDLERWTWTPHDPDGVKYIKKGARGRLKSWEHAALTNYRPSAHQQNIVLLFHIGLLNHDFIHWFRHCNVKYFYLSFDQLASHGNVKIHLGEDRDSSELSIGPARLAMRDIKAVIWERPRTIFAPMSKVHLNDLLFMRRWWQVLRDLKGLLRPDTIWIPSHPMNGSQDWQNKIAEYRMAERVGLKVPSTLCTNDPNTAREFIQRHRERVLFREFSLTPFMVPPKFIHTKGRAVQLKNLKRSPCVFQRFIDKQYDVRAVVLGDEVFACRIDSQASELAKIDWRVHDDARVKWELFRLPRAVERSMCKLLKELDLLWGSFDLVKGKDEELYFLEVNRPGACYWLRSFVGLDMAEKIVRFIQPMLDPGVARPSH